MIKNYLKTNKVLILRHLLCLFFILGHQSNAQCTTPAVGCPKANLANFGADSNHGTARIEYNNFISSFDTTILRTSDGSFQTRSASIGNNDVADILTPITINATNFPALDTVILLKAALGSSDYWIK